MAKKIIKIVFSVITKYLNWGILNNIYSINKAPPKPLLSKAFFNFLIKDNNANCVLKTFLYPHK